MSHRYSRKDAEIAFERLAKKMGRPVGHYRKCGPGINLPQPEANAWVHPSGAFCTIPGGWAFDWNPTYGGGVVEEISSNGGTGVSHPLGEGRMSAREFCQAVYFAERVLEAMPS